MLVTMNGHIISGSSGITQSAVAMKNPFKVIADALVWIKDMFMEIRLVGFGQWLQDQLLALLKELIFALLQINDLFFAIPAFVLMVTYFLMGKNKTTRWIIPLWVMYAVTEIIKQIYFLG